MSTLKFLKLDGRMALEISQGIFDWLFTSIGPFYLILFEYQACYYNQSLIMA